MQLNLVEIFSSVQGETSLAGIPSTFIRLAACNLRCTWCDTPYSFGRGTPYSFDHLFEKIEQFGCRAICITGGEPLLQQAVIPFMTRLCDQGFTVSLETGGSLPIQPVDPRVRTILDVKCPGSGMAHKNYWPNLPVLRPHDEVKFVLLDQADYAYAKDICTQYALYGRERYPLFSPVHGQLNPQHLVQWILDDQLRVRLNLQQHKYIWCPQTRGV